LDFSLKKVTGGAPLSIKDMVPGRKAAKSQAAD